MVDFKLKKDPQLLFSEIRTSDKSSKAGWVGRNRNFPMRSPSRRARLTLWRDNVPESTLLSRPLWRPSRASGRFRPFGRIEWKGKRVKS
jgi:hypothetical protein